MVLKRRGSGAVPVGGALVVGGVLVGSLAGSALAVGFFGLAAATATAPAGAPPAVLGGPGGGVRFSAPATAQEPVPAGDADAAADSVAGAALSVHLLTVGPGDRLWELFGHNALVVRDSTTGYEAAFNYGIFDFDAPGYASRFVQGRMTYWVDARPLDATLAGARAADRAVWAQELDLDPEQKLELLRMLLDATRPENREYRYHYYLNNCSTKLRDVLDAVLDGRLRAATGSAPSGATWRDHTRRLTAPSAVGYLGLQLLVGPRGDEPTSRWEEMWVPMKLRDAVAETTIRRADGSRVPLVRSQELWVESTREPELIDPPPFDVLFPMFGLACAIIVAMAGYSAVGGSKAGRAVLATAGAAWCAFCSAVALLLVFMHWTDHEFLYWNWNLLVFSPLALALAFLLPRMSWQLETGPWTRRLTATATALTLGALALSLVPGLAQDNREWAAFALPIHFAFYWVATRILPARGRLVFVH